MSRSIFQDLSDLPDAGPESAPLVSTAERPAPVEAERHWVGRDLSQEEDAIVDLPAQAAAPTQPRPARRPRRGLGAILALALAGLALMLAAREARAFVENSFRFHAAFGWANVALLSIVVLLIGWIVLGEVRAYQRLGVCRRLREMGRRCREAPEDEEAARGLVEELSRLLGRFEEKGPPALCERVREARLRLGPESTAGEWIEQAESLLLPPLDEQASHAIQTEAFNVGLGTAVSPYGFIDAALVLWRNARLIRSIAEIYQLRPGAWGTWLLIKRTVTAVALADLAQEASIAVLGAFRGIASLISPLGQGLTNATLTIRLGLLAQAECRPLPLPEEKRAGTASLLSRSVLHQIRRLIRARKRQPHLPEGMFGGE